MISIVIPIYNAESFIDCTIASVNNQDYKDWELILVNDGSKDDTGRIIDEIAHGEDRIHSFHQENGGEVSARRTGVLHSKGEWIMFVDADDILPSNAITSLIQYADGVDIVAGTMHVHNLDNSGCIIEDYVWKNRRTGCLSDIEFAQGIFLGEVQMAVWSKLYKRSLFDGFDWCLDRTIRQNPDLLMNIGLGARAKSVYVTNEAVCYDYIIHSGSASTSGMMEYQGWRRLFEVADRYIALYAEPKVLEESFFHYQLSRYDAMMRHSIIDQPVNDEYVQRVLALSSQFRLSNDEEKVLQLLRYPMLRVVFNMWQQHKK